MEKKKKKESYLTWTSCTQMLQKQTSFLQGPSWGGSVSDSGKLKLHKILSHNDRKLNLLRFCLSVDKPNDNRNLKKK